MGNDRVGKYLPGFFDQESWMFGMPGRDMGEDEALHPGFPSQESRFPCRGMEGLPSPVGIFISERCFMDKEVRPSSHFLGFRNGSSVTRVNDQTSTARDPDYLFGVHGAVPDLHRLPFVEKPE